MASMAPALHTIHRRAVACVSYDYPMQSYPSGGLPTVPGGVQAPGTVHGLHGTGSPYDTQATMPGAYGTPPGGSPYGTQATMPGMHSMPGPSADSMGMGGYGSGAYGAGGSAGMLPPGSQGGRLDSAGTVHGLNSAGTLHGLQGAYPDGQYMGGLAPGSANSAGTTHDLHPGYGLDRGYSAPPSAQQQFQPFGQQPPTSFGAPQAPPGQVVGKLMVRIIGAYNLKNTDLGVVPGELSDPHCVIKLGNQEHQTDVVRNNLNPVFNSSNFEFLVPNEDDVLQIEVFNASQFYAHDTLGKLSLHLHNIVSCPGEVQSRTDVLKGGGNGKLEYELYYVPPERMMQIGANGRLPPSGKQAPYMELQVQHKPVQHRVPLPDFSGFGPAAFAAPPPEFEKAPAGELKKKQEYESWACHLGQYDYDKEGPTYFPNQEVTDRHAWSQDPFYRALEDTDRSLQEVEVEECQEE